MLNGALKIGREEHILDLQKHGHLFCNTIQYFRELEGNDPNRKDSREGAFKTKLVEDPENYKLTWNGKKVPAKLTFLRFNEFDTTENNLKLYCLFGFKKLHVTEKPFIDPIIQDFGSKALLITDLKEFINRIRKRLKELEINFQYGFVNYYEESGINKNLSVFHKPNKFKYQHEYRILIKEKSNDPFSFNIGSIEDISVLIETEKLTDLRIKKEGVQRKS